MNGTIWATGIEPPYLLVLALVLVVAPDERLRLLRPHEVDEVARELAGRVQLHVGRKNVSGKKTFMFVYKYATKSINCQKLVIKFKHLLPLKNDQALILVLFDCLLRFLTRTFPWQHCLVPN